MTHPSIFLRQALPLVLLLTLASAFAPARGRAEMPSGADLGNYGFRGLALGAGLGLSIGYIMTGSRWESEEWKPVVIDMGLGAVSGLTTGLILAVIDSTSGGTPGAYYMLRDSGYGSLLGGVLGAGVGSLVWVDHGSSKDVLICAAWGSIIGAGAGLVYGIIEAGNTRRGDRSAIDLGHGLSLNLTPPPPQHGPGMAAVLQGPLDL